MPALVAACLASAAIFVVSQAVLDSGIVTDAMGVARFPVKIAKRDSKGTWQAGVLASAAGASASAIMTLSCSNERL